MINFLSSWVKNLSLSLIIVSILEMILPNNKTKKYVRTVMGLYILFSIISPFIENDNKINLNNINLDSYTENIKVTSSEVEEVDQTSMDNRINEIYKEELQRDIIQKIEEKGYKVETCKVVAYISEKNSEIEKITIKINGKMNGENNNDVNTDTIENKIVTEIQKVNISIGESKEKKEEENNITQTDIKVIKDFLIKEYGVSEKCLKIS